MKAMKQVAPGRYLPVSYLTNSKEYEMDGGGRDLPGYKTSTGDYIVRFHFAALERWGAFRRRTDQPKDFIALREYALALRKLSTVGWLRFFLYGDIWQMFRSEFGPFSPLLTSASFPVQGGDTKNQQRLAAIMSGRNMVGDGGIAETAVVTCNGRYVVEGISATFATEADAIAAYGADLRLRNKGKWDNAKDFQTRGPENPDGWPTLLCPTCDVAIFMASMGTWGCRICKKKFIVVDHQKAIVRPEGSGV